MKKEREVIELGEIIILQGRVFSHDINQLAYKYHKDIYVEGSVELTEDIKILNKLYVSKNIQNTATDIKYDIDAIELSCKGLVSAKDIKLTESCSCNIVSCNNFNAKNIHIDNGTVHCNEINVSENLSGKGAVHCYALNGIKELSLQGSIICLDTKVTNIQIGKITSTMLSITGAHTLYIGY